MISFSVFGEGCRSICHCLNGVGCNNVNGQCPHKECDAGWKPSTCSEGTEPVSLTFHSKVTLSHAVIRKHGKNETKTICE
jgi:hypothetical protein